MQKDFDKWNEKKKTIHNSGENKLYHAREIWWCSLGVNIGSEQDGDNENYTRPILILRGLSRNTCLIVPLTSSKEIHKMRIPIGNVQGKSASVIISQIKIVDTKRLIYKVGFLDKNIFQNVAKAARNLL